MELPIARQDVTTIESALRDIQSDVRAIRILLEETRERKKKHQKMTPEEHAQRDETQRLVRERIAYHEAKEREEQERRAAERR
jgi:hypothetical protein